METIRTYLENMFLHLPETPEIRRARTELEQMMEDKYNELKSAGKSENEAIGIVISEFGNLDELEELSGLGNPKAPDELSGFGNANESDESSATESLRTGSNDLHRTEYEKKVTLDEAQAYLASRKSSATRLSVGVMLCVIAVCGPIISAAFEENERLAWTMPLGIAAMFVLIGVGVGLIVYASTRDAEWKEILRGPCRSEADAEAYVRSERSRFYPIYTMMLTIGIVLCIVSIVPVTVFGVMEDTSPDIVMSEMRTVLACALMFALIGLGVLFIVMGSTRKGAYDRLLRGTNQAGPEPDEEDEEMRKLTPVGRRVMRIYWPAVTCIYLIYSFVTFRWGSSWIIWPIAAVLSVLLRAIFRKES